MRRAAAVERELAAIDLACSRFRDDSELSALNAPAGGPFAVEPAALEAIDVALRAAQRSRRRRRPDARPS